MTSANKSPHEGLFAQLHDSDGSPDKSPYEKLFDQLHDQDDFKRANAKVMLMQYASHQNPKFRLNFATEISKIPGNPDVAGMFLLFLKDEDPAVSGLAKNYLAAHPEIAMEKLKTVLSMDSQAVKLKAILLLLELGANPVHMAAASSMLQQLSRDKDERVRDEARAAFQNLGSMGIAKATIKPPSAAANPTIQEKQRQGQKS